MDELRPNSQRAKKAIALIWVVMITCVITLILEIIQLLVSYEIIPEEYISENTSFIIASIAGYTAILTFLALITSAITFIQWFRRAYYNLEKKMNKLEYSNGWAAGAWFIPIINLFVPYRIMKELYIKTDQYLLLNSKEPYTERLKTDYVKGWWTIWIFSLIFGSISFRIEWSFSSIDTGSNLFLSVINSAIETTLCIITIIIIEDYNKAEKLLFETEEKEDSSIEKAL